MRKLNRSKPYGTVTPPWMAPGTDRPASYEQDGVLFDQWDHEIVPGKKSQAEVPSQDPGELSPVELIAGAETIPWGHFHREAKRVLGEKCPGGKAQIVSALKKAVEGYEARHGKRAPKAAKEAAKANGVEAPAAEEIKTAVSAKTPSAKPASPVAPGTVDLASWGRGQKNYLFHQVRKALRDQHQVVVGGEYERRDAVNHLVDLKVINAAEARRDV